ncbi:hypothetical protein [Pseudomonas rhodesiae]|uniref:hypothetical protein n=1 Tax=Pseudomonas rhodesiae TaxID=76760 RepID=UPI0028D5835D|nr:hypothetical protein [Pseudomonas rhodesiae]
MKVKALWGFVGNADLLGVDSPKVVRGQELDIADEEYAHALIGKELVEEIDASGKPKIAKPKESKPTASKEVK